MFNFNNKKQKKIKNIVLIELALYRNPNSSSDLQSDCNHPLDLLSLESEQLTIPFIDPYHLRLINNLALNDILTSSRGSKKHPNFF